jgi:hypothetical protein
MTDVKQLVSDAVKTAWPTFEADHPRLAAVIDQLMLIDGVIDELADDPAYAQALGNADAAGQTAQEIADFVTNYVVKGIKQLA